MPLITFVQPDGSRETLDAPDGDTVMEVAFDNAVDGILGDCGGNAMCATCHVYVDVTHLVLLPPVGVTEDAMLETVAAPRHENSRLSCQLPIANDLEGAEFTVPEAQ